ncbi:MAG: 16S rRNA (guanine(966)-N(2))-methyltransferase RsmD, partial [Planctomycetota bacterium]
MRITKGLFKGRKLFSPKGKSARPTLARVRESFFDFLGNIQDFTVLDLYAGTGALGLEALSRGAKEVIFVEARYQNREILKKNIQLLGVEEKTKLFPGKVENIPTKTEFFSSKTFDLVFVDPPYDYYIKENFFFQLKESLKVLSWAENAAILFDHPSKVSFPTTWERIQGKIFGDKGWSAFWVDSLL